MKVSFEGEGEIALEFPEKLSYLDEKTYEYVTFMKGEVAQGQ